MLYRAMDQLVKIYSHVKEIYFLETFLDKKELIFLQPLFFVS